MKVCTDACLFGAWVASLIRDHNTERALDMGAGTGLLSLMIAQVSAAEIDAVEIDESSFQQAAENFKSSPWSERLRVFHCDINKYVSPIQYDLILSNPPFYENDLLSDDDRRNVALHSVSFTLDDLLKNASRLLKRKGLLAVLLPCRRVKEFEEIIKEYKFFITRKVKVKQTPKHDCFRCMYLLSQDEPGSGNEMEIVIKESDQYTDDFYSLVKDYYL